MLLLLGACAGSGSQSASRQSAERGTTGDSADRGSLDWSGCDDPAARLAGLECSRLEVPLDPSQPDGESIELALARSTATGTASQRLGSLLLNPGGPGGSGIEFLSSAAAAFPDELLQAFDLVSFDPRGVGASTPVRCLDDRGKDAQLEGDLSPDDDEELRRAIDEVAEFLQGCERRSGGLIRHMSTADVAADLDRIREAVGDAQLTYLGFSYGTSIGATYATLFPEKVRAMVLDGAVSPDASVRERLLAQGRGFERTLERFRTACDRDRKCPLGPDSAAEIARTRAELAEDPVVVDDPTGRRTMGTDLFDIALATALYDTTLWGTAANAIAEIRNGGSAVLFSLVDRQIGRKADGTYDNSSDAQAMVNCADSPERLTEEEAVATARELGSELGIFGDALAWGSLACLDWPRPVSPLPPVSAEGAPPILVIGTLGDPATPYEWSEEMAAALGPGVLITYEGDGHTAFLRAGPCIDDAVVDYLVHLRTPQPGTRCPATTGSVSFGGLRDEVLSQLKDAGLPPSVAECIIDRIVGEVGEAGLDQLLLGNDIERLTSLITKHSVRCAGGLGD
jgi:pimeloyl-ACP methyl ester carboxylesterase